MAKGGKQSGSGQGSSQSRRAAAPAAAVTARRKPLPVARETKSRLTERQRPQRLMAGVGAHHQRSGPPGGT